MNNKLKVSPDRQKQIETARRGKGWTTDQCSQALPAASLYQFKNVILPALGISIQDKLNPTLKLNWLKKIIEKNKITKAIDQYSTITSNIFTDNSKLQSLISINQLIKDGNEGLKLNDLFYNYGLITDRITYRNWKYFLSGKLIDEDIFIAFCSVLGVSWEEVIDQETPVKHKEFKHKDSTETSLLVEVLNTFNHKEQKDLVCSNLASSHAPKAFLVINSCSYRRTWMLRRIAYEIETFGKEVKPEDFLSNSKHTSPSINDLTSIFNERFNERSPAQSLNEVLKSKYIFLIINVDDYYLNDFKNLINEFWKPILARVNPEKPGKILMFMISSDRGNDWQTEWKNCDILKDAIAELTPANPFQAQDLIEILPRIALKLDKTLKEDPVTLSQSILEKGQGGTEKIIRALYGQFDCKTEDLIRQWQNYPHR
ncbi:hypothetical protein L2E67_07700 [Planktothrix agardhii 1803]|jgi:inactive STAND|uniref:hypothetical protein n=1 Tax=Planktothrix agardhii TaxID=1160 RepID=UPI001F2DD5DC|nr:hypothetical protein [Planktothrix agardhii]MCF3572147.1 hypothetical protein [Planktothrix agardhii 1805]MCF3584962.1 hypothetical protein [Planktothrix agardhii 1803]MCP9293414.1 hypothetical protein [Planktothrix agardhii LY1]CAD5958385.1 hypothetical protein PCC7811_03001 [Planktothrix agardhii]